MNKSRNQACAQYVAAAEIAALLATRPTQHLCLGGVEDSLNDCRRWLSRFDKARIRGWHCAARESAERYRDAVDRLRKHAESISAVMQRKDPEVSPSSIFHEIRALRQEFDDVVIQRSTKQLRCRTEEIVLESVYLGRFEIVLRWDRINDTRPYEVLSVAPGNGTRDGTTHPHVQGDTLCEGDGATAIKRALQEGRLYDFFSIVDRILKTYNAASAYVSLDDWDGVTCRCCGDTVDSDDLSRCTKCETELCDDCSTSCDSCSDRFCSECIGTCAGCHNYCCHYCGKSCDECDECFCDSCLHEGMCDDCVDRNEQESAEVSDFQTEQPRA
ncbi:hypothetical protein LOC67_10815 [Stieleria sp. JC731]|uniref:hypothetical protein n=1 Tax=Pirellulaceae TaxID=2691357 RepID=UPI001E306A5D|nr:hypothetical protein [Stieleria sp. JC731]MCC9601037.1 hypothetical protein [Stieleria sp. JC731]